MKKAIRLFSISLIVSGTVMIIFSFTMIMFSSDDHYQECERYNAARIPQPMNPCWGDVKK